MQELELGQGLVLRSMVESQLALKGRRELEAVHCNLVLEQQEEERESQAQGSKAAVELLHTELHQLQH